MIARLSEGPGELSASTTEGLRVDFDIRAKVRNLQKRGDKPFS